MSDFINSGCCLLYTSDAADEVKGKTELDAVIAYLQVLGTSVK